jgi:hypothetical protein
MTKQTPEQLADKIFKITMIGIVLFTAVVFVFVLNT